MAHLTAPERIAIARMQACSHNCDSMPASQLTIRNVDEDLSERLRAISAAAGESLNATVLRILRDAVGVDARRERLRRYATWTDEQFEEFNTALRAQRVIDEKMWK